MSNLTNLKWLPPKELFSNYRGSWSVYLDALYAIFQADFVYSKPVFQGRPLGLKRHPIVEDKEATFWHLISEGGVEEERIPDMRRCERIRWPKVIIEAVPHLDIKVWQEHKKSELRTYLWVESEGYLVVLNQRKDYLLWTAFYVERQHQREKYNKRWQRNQ